jgi:hypothetical protein
MRGWGICLVAIVVTMTVSLLATQGAAAGDAPSAPTIEVLSQEEPQEQPGANGDEPDNILEIQLWTVIASVAAGAVFLLLFVLRVIMGWIAVPTQDEIDAAAHH